MSSSDDIKIDLELAKSSVEAFASPKGKLADNGDRATVLALKLQAMFRAKRARAKANEVREEKLRKFENKIKMESPLRSTCYYMMFLVLFAVAVFLRVDSEALYFVTIMDDWVVQEEFSPSDSQIYKNFNDIQSVQEFWQYLNGPFTGNMFRESVSDRTELFPGTVVVGQVNIRGIRVKVGGALDCLVPKKLEAALPGPCFPRWRRSYEDLKLEEQSPYPNIDKMTFRTNVSSAFKYSSQTERHVTVYEAWKNSFPSRGGYVIALHFDELQSEVRAKLNELQEKSWVDDAMRGIFIEFSVYNKQSSLFANVRLLVEFYATGGCGTYPTIEVAKVNSMVSEQYITRQTASVVLRIIVYVSVCMLSVREILDAKEVGLKKHFKSYWNWLDLLNYGVFFIQMFYFLSYLIYSVTVRSLMESTDDPTGFVDIAYLTTLYQYVDWVSSLNVFLSFMKLFEYLQSSKNIARIFNTIVNSGKRLLPLLIVILIMNGCFALTFFVGFSYTNRELRSLSRSLATCFLTMFGAHVGDSWEADVYHSNRYLGTILIFFYRLIGGYVIVAMFVSLIDEAYEDTLKEVEATHANDLFLSNLMIQKNKCQRKLNKRFPKFLSAPPKYTMTIAQITKDHQLQVEKKFHRRTTKERLENVEHMLKRVLFNTTVYKQTQAASLREDRAETKEKANSTRVKQRRRSSVHF